MPLGPSLALRTTSAGGAAATPVVLSEAKDLSRYAHRPKVLR